MTDEFVQTLKDILDNAGIDVSVEQLESGLNAMATDIPEEDPWLAEVIRKIEEEHKDRPEPDDEGYSFKGKGDYHAASGEVELEYSGRAHKKYQGGAVLLMKPDDSLVVHGLRGVNPVCYMARADDIRFKGKDRKLTITATAGQDRLTMTFLKMDMYEELLKDLPHEIVKQTTGPDNLTTDEKALEARLKRLRIDIAHDNGVSFLPAIYDNRVLYALVKQRPGTLEDLKKVKGLGEKRIGKYGDSILQAIRETVSAGT